MKKGQIDLTTALELAKNNVMANLNCHNIGKIATFYPETQTADIEIMQIKTQYGQAYNLPLLLNVPVVIYGSSNASITLGDLTGTICLLFFMDRNIDSFLTTGENYIPSTGRMHDITDCIALTTFKTDVNPLSDYDTQAITLRNSLVEQITNENSYIKVYPSYVEIKADVITETEEETTESSSYLNVNEGSILLENSAGGQIEVNNKINIANASQNLADLIQSLLSACENITVDTNTGALTPASKQAFTDLATQFEELLQ